MTTTASSSSSGTESGGALNYLIKPIYLAWTPTISERVSSTLKSLTNQNMSALLEFEIGNPYNNIGCTKKLISCDSMKNWTSNSDPINNPDSYFDSTNFGTSGNSFYLWNEALMVRGNNSHASAAKNEKALNDFTYDLDYEKISTATASGNKIYLDYNSITDLWDEDFDPTSTDKNYFSNPLTLKIKTVNGKKGYVFEENFESFNEAEDSIILKYGILYKVITTTTENYVSTQTVTFEILWLKTSADNEQVLDLSDYGTEISATIERSVVGFVTLEQFPIVDEDGSDDEENLEVTGYENGYQYYLIENQSLSSYNSKNTYNGLTFDDTIADLSR